MLADLALIAAKTKAGMRRRAYWQIRYHDGRIIPEWERDWLDLPHQGRVALRLVCPNGQVGEVGNSRDATGRLFQFKLAVATAVAADSLSDKTLAQTLDWVLHGTRGRATVAHLIGIVNDFEGNCLLWAWEPEPGRLVGPLNDNIYAMQYGGGMIRSLSADALGIRPD